MRIRPAPSSLLACMSFALALTGCSKDNSPSRASERTWTLYGKTYLVAAVDPLPGVTVKCANVSTVSGPDGAYELRGIPEGTQMITAAKSNCEDFSHSIEVRADTRYYIFLTFNGTRLAGLVTNALDGPVKSARLVIHGIDGYTDASGQFELSDIPHGVDTLYVTHPNYVSYKAALTLSTSDKQFDVVLQRDSVLPGAIWSTKFVYEGQPNQVNFTPTNVVFLSTNNLYVKRNQRNIYIRFEFPSILNDSRVSIVGASLQLCTYAPYPQTPFQTFAVDSHWDDATLSFFNQPSIGSLLFSGTVADSNTVSYWSVLKTDGFQPLLVAYRSNGVSYGVVIQGGRETPTGFYSLLASSSFRPKVTFKVRF